MVNGKEDTSVQLFDSKAHPVSLQAGGRHLQLRLAASTHALWATDHRGLRISRQTAFPTHIKGPPDFKGVSGEVRILRMLGTANAIS